MLHKYFLTPLAAFMLLAAPHFSWAQPTPSGGVGIGTTAPQATLHVAGAASTVRLEGLGGSGVRVLTADATGNVGSQAQPALGVSGQTLTLTSGSSVSNVTLPTNTGATGPQGPSGALGKYGDGSAGAFTVGAGQTVDLTTNSATTYLPAGANMQFSTITVNGTLIVPSGMVLRCTGNVSVSGTITVATGATAGAAVNAGVALGPPSGLLGGTGLPVLTGASLPIAGSTGGGAGLRSSPNDLNGEGGGRFALLAGGNITVSAAAQVRANGNSATNLNTAGQGIPGAGGGAGGILVLAAKGTLTVAGTLSATGGNGASGFDGNGGAAEGGGGGGGGGIIRLLSSASPSVTGNVLLSGGSAGANAGTNPNSNAGGGGGGCGGNGGLPGSTTITASAGVSGYNIMTVTPTPENLLN